MKKILVAVDYSSVSHTVIGHAATLAHKFGAELWIMHVAPPDLDYFKGMSTAERNGVAQGLQTEHHWLQEQAQQLRAGGVTAHALLVRGAPVEAILMEATKLNADMIVMGSHGHTALYRVLVGSVSEGVLRDTKVPLLVIPARESKGENT
ncbi:MAG: universal stress protein [Gammaproteobacteria bacterium]|nr:universal stress protein [Gammaproteobacteria bacterium]